MLYMAPKKAIEFLHHTHCILATIIEHESILIASVFFSYYTGCSIFVADVGKETEK